jgi:CspA family cold shock protein
MGKSNTRTTGTIKRLVFDKGFGFITSTGPAAGLPAPEFFFHRSACDDFNAYAEGTKVSFDIGTGPKGPRAENVRMEA